MSHEQRDAPAYQEYAAAMLSNIQFRLLTLSQRGLFYTMRMECWHNRKLPADAQSLAFVIGQPRDEVEENLPAVLPFYTQDEDGMLFSRELEDYRKKLAERHARQREGGKRGAEKTNSKRGKKPASHTSGDPPPDLPGTPAGNPRAPRRGVGGSSVQSSTDQNNPDQSNPVINGEGNATAAWLAEYDGEFHE